MDELLTAFQMACVNLIFSLCDLVLRWEIRRKHFLSFLKGHANLVYLAKLLLE